jgi:hypothetical protein
MLMWLYFVQNHLIIYTHEVLQVYSVSFSIMPTGNEKDV